MESGMIGLCRMGTNTVRRLRPAGHQCVVYDLDTKAVDVLVKEGAVGASSLEDFAGKLKKPRDAETAPLRHPEKYPYDLNLADIAEVWRRGSVIASWLLDLAAAALLESPDLENFAGRVSDSGEGRWTIAAAIDESVPAPVLSAALYQRYSSRGGGDFADKVLSALRFGFGGHQEKGAAKTGDAS